MPVTAWNLNKMHKFSWRILKTIFKRSIFIVFFLGSFGKNQSPGQTYHLRIASWFTLFVCLELRFIPNERRKKGHTFGFLKRLGVLNTNNASVCPLYWIHYTYLLCHHRLGNAVCWLHLPTQEVGGGSEDHTQVSHLLQEVELQTSGISDRSCCWVGVMLTCDWRTLQLYQSLWCIVVLALLFMSTTLAGRL